MFTVVNSITFSKKNLDYPDLSQNPDFKCFMDLHSLVAQIVVYF